MDIVSKLKVFAGRKSTQIGGAFILGASGAAAVTYYAVKGPLEQKYAQIATEEIAEARKMYSALKKTDMPTPAAAVAALIPEADLAPVTILQDARPSPVNYKQLSSEAKDEADELKEAEQEEKEESLPAEIINVFEEYGADKDEMEGWDYEAEEARRDPNFPYIISEAEYLKCERDFEQSSLTYFEADDVLVDESDQIIQDDDGVVGTDNLLKFGHGAGGRDVVFIRNELLMMEFEVERSRGKYAEEVLGFLEHSEKSSIRRFRNFDD